MARSSWRPSLRVVSLLVTFTFAFVLVAARLIHLQVVIAPDLKERAYDQHVRTIELAADRGSLLDRDLDPLVVSRDAYGVFANPALIAEDLAPTAIESLVDQLADLLGGSRSEVAAALGQRERGFVYLARRVDRQTAAAVEELPHIGTVLEPSRAYPVGGSAGQLLGLVDIDNKGISGLELENEATLAGVPGQRIFERDIEGRAIPQGVSSLVEPIPGRDVVLSIDRDLQFLAEDALRRGAARSYATRGTAVVLDVDTGQVLAVANHPSLDPAVAGDASDADRRNRAIVDMYEPGSVFKVVTAAAAFQHRVASPNTKLTVPYRISVGGSSFRDFSYHPTQRMTYAEAIARSSNVATIKIALEVGERRLWSMLRGFGIGKQTGVGFPGEVAGLVPELDTWSGTSIATIPIGQGVAVTPLQLASIYQTIANDGVRVPPRLVRGTTDAAGAFELAKAPRGSRVIDPYVAAQIRGMLVGAVEGGTGARAQIPGYVVGGKTGTAFIPRTDARGYSNRINTTFAGFAPADDPRVVVVVQLEDPQPRLASETAAPIFREIMLSALIAMNVAPSVTDRDSVADREASVDVDVLRRRIARGARDEGPPTP